jgi:hypothetical protein
MREALNSRRNFDATVFLEATQAVRRVICDLIQSDHGGPLTPEKRKFWDAVTMLMGADSWITHRIAEARVAGSADANELRAARRTVQALLSDLFASRNRTSRDVGE